MSGLNLQWVLDHPRDALLLAIATVFIAATATSLLRPKSPIPVLSGTIPRLSITLLYMTDMETFYARAKSALREKNIVQFYLGTTKAYLVTGANNIQAMFRTSASVNSDVFILMVQKHIWNITGDDYAKFANDKSGRLKVPAPGTEDTPEERRYWAGMHNIMHRYITRTNETNVLAKNYQRFFEERLERFPLGKGMEVCVYDFLLKDMATAVVTAVNGKRILEMTPDLFDLLWSLDEVAASLVWGLPRWLNRDTCNKRDRFHGAVARYLESAFKDFDWDTEGDPEWEPILGCRFIRELLRWMREKDFSLQAMASALGVLTLFGANANTIPVTAWCVMEIFKDPKLFKAVREELETTYETCPISGQRTINAQTLTSLPLLQSIYIEGLRLHVSMNVTREITGPIELSGGITPEKGTILQAATEITHYDESIWGRDKHPASEFWAERHVKYVDDGHGKRVRQFVMAGGPNDFFPYGGGVSICPGRFFAKQEIMLAIAIMVSRFNVEFLGWVNRDGTPSDRPALNDVRWSGGAAQPPDRDMKVLLKRVW
ncbi:hypothetical protein MFIFM68171_02125 [Madurella fahalii]|uniref:Cytochrome P450 n=1 Tax=Madurella fahalii TaxID=1157608 RepID=A0ABQ0G2C6_9PEZI